MTETTEDSNDLDLMFDEISEWTTAQWIVVGFVIFLAVICCIALVWLCAQCSWKRDLEKIRKTHREKTENAKRKYRYGSGPHTNDDQLELARNGVLPPNYVQRGSA